MKLPVVCEIDDVSRIGECRRRAKVLGRGIGFSEVDRERIGIAVSEGVSNVLRYADSGYFLAQVDRVGGEEAVTVLIWDQGPGFANVSRCLEDGYSSGKGQGIGLGAMQRQADIFKIHSAAGEGAVVSMTFLAKGKRPPEKQDGTAEWDIFGTAIPLPGEIVSGDAWAAARSGSVAKILLVDGLGHGPKAETAAKAAITYFSENTQLDGHELMHGLHAALRGTRGAVAALADIDRDSGRMRFTGIGNISAKLYSPEKTQHLVSLGGTVGYQIGKVKTFEYDWSEVSVLTLHSDGLSGKCGLKKFPGLFEAPASTIAGRMLSGHRKLSDDCSVVVTKGWHRYAL